MSHKKALLLTPWMQIHKITSIEMAIRLVYLGKARVLEAYEETISSPSVTWRIPAVIQLIKPLAGMKKGIKFSKVNVYTRDDFKCLYCGEKKPVRELTYDHVVPRVQGGKTNFHNIVTACKPCNSYKGGRTPEQAKMKLLKKPEKPKYLPYTPPLFDDQPVPEEWKLYLPSDSAITSK